MPTHPIRFGIQTGQQHVEWSELSDLWRKADEWGYDSLWTFDHFYPIFVPDPSGPCLEAWTALSALSQQTKRARIGALVTGNTYRNPCVLAKMAATLDQVSGGRLNLGVGSGWFELEHRSFGIDFKTIPGRLQALDESIQIIKGMFTQDKTTLHGRHYDVTDAFCNPKPLQKPHPPIMIGGQGEKVLLKLVAKHADMWNLPNASAEKMAQLIGVIDRHGDIVGRDTDEIEKTVMIALCYGAPKERQDAMSGLIAAMSQSSPEQVRRQMMIGSRDECLETIDRYTKAGVTHFIFMMMAPYFIDDVQRFAEEVIPAFKS
ncbi:MAG: LLM class F420-dependent oxidoreductase [Candidatus Binatus sp.]|uniref:LLM class F420-dependent oxidoreductase n=1 Tax=Candidatus Binatus sp. TaxID=2811406 RepID=UPI00271F76DF|nr:LLM class F420-dependent oxidoreductase [Candidatus Binatus sp.]MDO8434822.1 LLM class F420-dependent oxidoreductase [Candidatus Binatus sp.]